MDINEKLKQLRILTIENNSVNISKEDLKIVMEETGTYHLPVLGYLLDKGYFVVAENAVKEKLKSPSTAQFCTTTEATIGRNDNTWTVKGWVDAQNGYGAMVRANFVVTFTFASKNTYSVALCTVS